jgi:WD40 repeat protein
MSKSVMACCFCTLQDVKSIAWHPSKELLASCSYDNSIKLWANDEADWVCVQTLEGKLLWVLGWCCGTWGEARRFKHSPCSAHD